MGRGPKNRNRGQGSVERQKEKYQSWQQEIGCQGICTSTWPWVPFEGNPDKDSLEKGPRARLRCTFLGEAKGKGCKSGKGKKGKDGKGKSWAGKGDASSTDKALGATRIFNGYSLSAYLSFSNLSWKSS